MFKYVPPELINQASECLGRFSSTQKVIVVSVVIAATASLIIPLIFPKISKLENFGLLFVSLNLIACLLFAIFGHFSCGS